MSLGGHGCYKSLEGDHNLQRPAGNAECTLGVATWVVGNGSPGSWRLEATGGAAGI